MRRGPEGRTDRLGAARRDGFTLVEALVGLGVAVGLACAVAGVAGVLRLAGERAELDARAARAVAALYAEARMGERVADVPGEEGRWAVTPRDGERVPVGADGAWAPRRRIEAAQRSGGGETIALDVLGEAVRP